jgi:antitoxin (DNA-binding transcriptional repressor) of toxin-antitoxin stability system
MKLPISEARKRLPELVRRVRKNAQAKIEITVRDEVVAELRGSLPEPQPGAAAKKLRAIMRKLPRRRGPKTHVSSRVGQYLYGRPERKR